MARRLAAAWPALALIAVLSGCFPGGDPKPTELIAGIMSYSSGEEIKSWLDTANLSWRVKEEFEVPPQDGLPASRYVDLEVSGYCHLGMTGILILGFFDDQLSVASFYPDDWETYQKFTEYTGQRLVPGEKYRRSVNTVVSVPTDYQGRVYVSWIDEDLRRQGLNRSLKYPG